MIAKRLVSLNAAVTVLHVAVSGGMLFYLYRYLLESIGIEGVGVWSLVLVTTSLSNIATFGFGGSVVKHVAQYHARHDHAAVSGIVQTAVLTIAGFIGFIALALFPAASTALQYIVPASRVIQAVQLLPYALFSLWVAAVGNIYLAVMDGLQLVYLRSMVLLACQIVYVGASIYLVSRIGITGLGAAQVLQTILMTAASMVLLKRMAPLIQIIPRTWNRTFFKTMIGYGVHFQINSLMSMLYDPMTKALLSRYGGLALVGFFDMASKVILFARAALVNAAKVLVPTIAHLHEIRPELIRNVYTLSFRLLLFLALPVFIGIASFGPYISRIWIGQYERDFVFFTAVLSGGWFLNVLVSPSYFINLGTGDIRWNTLSHVTIALLNAGLGILFGTLYGGKTVSVSWALSLAIGSMIVPGIYHAKIGIAWRELLPFESLPIALACIIGAAAAVLLYHVMEDRVSVALLTVTALFAFGAVIIVPFWKHPMRVKLGELLQHLKPGRSGEGAVS